MAASYHIDPAQYPLKKLKEDLQTRELIPSRQSLKEGLDERFQILMDQGMHTLQDLINTLKTKKKLESFSEGSGLSIGYLTLLRREANSYLPKPVPLDRFPEVLPEDLAKLEKVGIKNSRQFFDQINSESDLTALGKSTGISRESLKELLALSDLVRAYGVGPVFARILYKAGIDSIRLFRQYAPQQVIDLYQERTRKKADFSFSDIKFSLDLVRILDLK
jgi:hypothetical protein